MKILVTGGNGFIGKNIKESYLAQKYNIVAPSRLELDCSDDKSVEAYFNKHSFDVVIHSAAKAGHRNAVDISNLFLTNSRMMFNLLKHQNSWGKLLNMGLELFMICKTMSQKCQKPILELIFQKMNTDTINTF